MFNLGSKVASSGAIPIGRLLNGSAACSKLFVGGLSYDTNEIALKDAFSQHGDVIEGLSYDTNEITLKDAFSQNSNVTEVKVICHFVTGRSKGYGFIKYSSETEAPCSIAEDEQ